MYFVAPNEITTFDKEIQTIKSTYLEINFIEINVLLPELTQNKEYWLDDNFHPSAKAWDLIVPKLSEQLHLK